ncbi:Trypsin [Popillia japonica]|uniref:Trypsin n=1 Tax=Popillia japonica TaxID=7064 RepID=A0AAW1NIF8_POPJA
MINLHFYLVLLGAAITSNYAFPHKDGKYDPKIVGGADATEGQFPWQVSLRYASNNEHFCGGSIIRSKWILTAGHCVAGKSAEDILIITGTISLSKGGNTHKISTIISHASFNPHTLINDIALIELESELDFNPSIQPIELETVPDNLQFVRLKTISNLECQLRLRWAEQSVTADNVCTLTKYGEGACHGDSGGPLVANGKLIGVVSWGNPCAIESPDVFTRVSSYVNWINSNIGNI